MSTPFEAWPHFARKFSVALKKLEEDQFLILSIKHSNQYIQFAAQGSLGMRAETTSNSYRRIGFVTWRRRRPSGKCRTICATIPNGTLRIRLRQVAYASATLDGKSFEVVPRGEQLPDFELLQNKLPTLPISESKGLR